MVKDKKTDIKLSEKEKIIIHLIENKNPQSIKSISGATFIDYKNTYNVIDNLDKDIFSKDKIGNTNLIGIKLEPKEEIYKAENKRTEIFLNRNNKLRLLREDIRSLNYPFLIILIFGSYTREENTSKSDIDLCIISDNEEKIKELVSKLEILPINLEIHDFKLKEFEEMLKTKENNIGKEIVKNNIILYGIENYYNLIAKWMKKE
jgi:predicted nucleotidyltransferase